EPGVVKYLSANQLRVAQKNGTFEFSMLASAEVTAKNKIEDVPVTQDFKDVFPSEISGLPPIRDIEFFIDLQPGTGP
ncbi:cellular nucleic acid-binding protein, partial [Trifolium medium]|nr:cellular nucleic acid-binding protein [Trifolium medium]